MKYFKIMISKFDMYLPGVSVRWIIQLNIIIIWRDNAKKKPLLSCLFASLTSD